MGIGRIGEFPRQEQKCMAPPTKKSVSQPHYHWLPLTSVVEESKSFLFSTYQHIWCSTTQCSIYHITVLYFFKNFYLFMIVTEREREAETQAEGEAGSMHREPDVGFDPGSP